MRLTEAEYAAIKARQKNPQWSAGQTKKAHKYHAQGVDIDGIHFASKLEGRCYEAQKLRQQAGHLRYFLRQVPFRLPGNTTYWADFFCLLTGGGEEVLDAKGVDTPMSKLKRKQVKEIYGVEVILWTDRKIGFRRTGS